MNRSLSTTIPTIPALVALLLTATGAAGQSPETWISAWGGVFPDPGTVLDDESSTIWDFGTTFAGGAAVQQLFGGSLLMGLEAGYAPIRHEVRDADTDEVLADGRAHLITTMLTGALGTGGRGVSTYLTGGIGAVTYGIPHLERWDSDFAFRAGGGLEYRTQGPIAFFLEWNRWWVFHQSEGVEDSTNRNSSFQLGLRYGV